MDWQHLLASSTGTVGQELLLRHAYRVTAKRILHCMPLPHRHLCD